MTGLATKRQTVTSQHTVIFVFLRGEDGGGRSHDEIMGRRPIVRTFQH